MLAGCSSSTLLSPRHRLRSEASAQFQACHHYQQLPSSMSTQRLDLPCNFPRKEASRSQPIRPVGLSVEKKPIEARTSNCSLKQNIRLPPLATTAQTGFIEGRRDVKDEFWVKGKSLKRFAEHDESTITRAKRKRSSSSNVVKKSDDDDSSLEGGGDSLSLGQFSSGKFWFQPNFEVSRSVLGITGFTRPQQISFPVSYSGEEERVCFVPSEVISTPLPLPNNPWGESIETEITKLGDKDVTSQGPVKEASGSSTSSESHHSLGLRLNEQITSEQEAGNGSGNFYPPEGAIVEEAGEEENQEEQQGLELVSSLMDFVAAIGSKNIAAINHFIAKLGDLASPKGTPITRLTAYFTEALALRVTRLWPHIFHITIPRELDRLDDDNGSTALRLLNQVSPIPKFIHFTANEILLRSFEGKDRVHIIDFDIKQGLQWPGLFQSLASRPNPPSHVRITGIGESKQELNETGDRLSGFAEALNLPFEFHPVVDRLEDVRLWMLHVKEGESVAVNCVFQLHKTLYDPNGGALKDFLGLIRSANPLILLMAEQEGENNDPSLEKRVCNSLKYYSAIFDSLDSSSLPLDSSVRIKIEEMFAREIRNIIACEGSDRYERHENFSTWRKLMEEGGFRSTGITEREMLQSQMLLKMYSCEKYSAKKQGEDGAAITLNWENQHLYTVSAWAPIDLAGSSSSFSQPS